MPLQTNTNPTQSILDPTFNQTLALKYDPPPVIKEDALLSLVPANWEDELKKMDPLLREHLNKHIGPQSTFTDKNDLIRDLKIVYCRLAGKLDAQLGAITAEERTLLLSKLTEEIDRCTAGHHDRVIEIKSSFVKPQNFAQLLQLVREDLVQCAAAVATAKLKGEVHATNTFMNIANVSAYGVRGRNTKDSHVGILTHDEIVAALAKQFREKFTPFNLPLLIAHFLRPDGYIGRKTKDGDSHTASVVIEFNQTINKFFGATHPDFMHYFIVDENDLIRDINWPLIHGMIFEKLRSDGYFQRPPVPQTISDLFFCMHIEIVRIFPEETVPCVTRGFNQQNKKKQADLIKKCHAIDPELFQSMVQKKEPKQLCDAFLVGLGSTPLDKWVDKLIQDAPIKIILNAFQHQNSDIYLQELESIDQPTAGDVDTSVIFEAAFNYFLTCPETEKKEQICVLLRAIIINENDTHKFLSVLLKKQTLGYWAGANGFNCLMTALKISALDGSSTNVAKITGTLNALIAKCDADKLAAGLSEKRTQGNNTGANGFHWLLTSVKKEINTPNSNLLKLFFLLLGKLSEGKILPADQEKILAIKNKLCVHLSQYLESIANNPNFEAMCSPNTMLGKLIDHDTSYFKLGITKIRKRVNEIIIAKTQSSLPAVATTTAPPIATNSAAFFSTPSETARLLDQVVVSKPPAIPPVT